MTTFLDCVRSAAEAGKITAKKLGEATEAYNEAYDDAIANGATEQIARDTAANIAVERTMKRKGADRWRKINELRRTHELWERRKAKDLSRDIDDLATSWDVAKERNANMMLRLLSQNLEKYRPQYAGLVHPVKDMDDIARAAYGERASPEAQQLATEILAVNEYGRNLANMWGASIHANPNKRLPQMHDSLKVRAVPQAEWVSEHMNRLDWDLMRYDDKAIPVAQREAILNRVYETIVNEGNNKIVPGQSNPDDNLGARLSKQRFLYYKDSKSYLEMQKKYGSGNIYQQTMGMVDAMSRDIAMLEKFGPNAAVAKKFYEQTMLKEAADREKTGTKNKTLRKKTEETLDQFNRRYEIHNHMLLNGEENFWAQTLASTRNLVFAPLLSSATISSFFGDRSTERIARLARGLPQTAMIKGFIENLVTTKASRADLVQMGLGFESATQMAVSMQRFLGGVDGHQFSRRFADTWFRVSALTPITQAGKWMTGQAYFRDFAKNAGRRFDQLEPRFQQDLARWGITDKDWDLFRKVPVKDGMLRPVDLVNAPGNSRQNQIVANKFLDATVQLTRESVVGGTQKASAILGGNTSPSTLQGQTLRTVTALSTVPIQMWYMLGRVISDAATTKDRLQIAAAWMVFTMTAGALITQVKELSKGRSPLDMSQPSFWIAALANGSTLGFGGDWVLQASRGNNPVSAQLSGPLVDLGTNVEQLATEGAKAAVGAKNKFGKEAIENLKLYGPRTWYTRALLDRYLYDTLLRQADPSAYQRLKRVEQKRMQEAGQQRLF